MDATAIATLMNAAPDEVTAAISAVEKWKASNSAEMVVASMNEQAMIAMEPVGRTLVQAQSAQRLISPQIVNPKTGEILRVAIYAPDYVTQIAATKAVAKIVESVRDRGPGMQVNIGGQHVHANGGGRSFEERLRLQREKREIRSGADGEITIDANDAMTMTDDSAGEVDDELDELEDDLDEELDVDVEEGTDEDSEPTE